ncbi:MAG: choice-of-anchor L domain-containing protein, partial [Hyphomicrobium sp.]
SVTQANSSDDLLAGLGSVSGITQARLTISGSAEATGVFDGDPFGLGSGIVLSTGRAEDLVGSNTSNGAATPNRSVQLEFVSLGASGNGSTIFRADLSGLGIDIRSITIGDSGLREGGLPGIFSGFDLDAIALSTKFLGSVDTTTNLNLSTTLPKLDVFDFNAASMHFNPGLHRENIDPSLVGTDFVGSLNGLVLQYFVDLGTFEATGLSLGDNGSIGFDLNRPVSTDGPLYLYVGETGAAGETPIANISVSADLIEPDGDLSTDLGALGTEGDTTKLTYAFTPDAGLNQIQFQFVVFSEELPEFSGAALADIFHIRVNGLDFASLSDGAALTIDNLQASPSNPAHPDLILNAPGSGPASGLTRADAFTRVLTLTAPVKAGVENVIEIEVSDTRDAFLDSGILIKGGSLVASVGTAFPQGLFDVPEYDDPANLSPFLSPFFVGDSPSTGFAVGLPSVSADGRFVAFSSAFSDGNGNSANNAVLVEDRLTDTIELISNFPPPSSTILPTTRLAEISPSGIYVAYELKTISQLSDNDPFIVTTDLIVKNRITGVATSVVETNVLFSDNIVHRFDDVRFSANDELVFVSPVAIAGIGGPGIYIRDMNSGAVTLARAQASAAVVDGFAAPRISHDGSIIAFTTSARLTTTDTDTMSDVYVMDMATRTVKLVSTGFPGDNPTGFNSSPELSGDGRYILFSSNADGINFSGPVDLRRVEIATGQTVLVAADVGSGAISADGNEVVFATFTANLVPTDTNSERDIFLKNLTTGEITQITQGLGGNPSNGSSSASVRFSADGNFVVFSTEASNLIPAGGEAGGNHNMIGYVAQIHGDSPIVSIDSIDARKPEGDSGTTDFTFSVTRTGDASSAASVLYAVSGAVDAADFGGVLPSGTVSFAANETMKIITVQVAGDTSAEASESFRVTLSAPTGASIGNGVAAGFILNDDANPGAGTVSIGNVSITEGDAGTSVATFNVNRVGGTAAFDVTYRTLGGTAIEGSDYVVTPDGTLHFGDGETGKTISVTLIGDTRIEANENFLVTLTGATNAALGNSVGTATIINDDAA